MLIQKDGVPIPCLCITNRKLCQGDFYEKIRRIASEGRADAILLREKDLPEEEYFKIADKVMAICREFQMECILHTYYQVAKELGCLGIHLPLPVFESVDREQLACFEKTGTSVHSVEQAQQAVKLGADYVTAGHVFDTECKKGIPCRGTGFIRSVSEAVRIPVYGIGGIDENNAGSVIRAGAQGVCLMSRFMK